MAEYEERNLEDLTEEPSQARIDELRKKGSVVNSRELTGTMVLLAVIIAIYALSGLFFKEFQTFMTDVFGKALAKQQWGEDWTAFTELGGRAGRLMLLAFLPVAGAGMVLGIATALAQTGFLFTTETLTPDLDRVNPVSGFFRVFSFKSAVDSAKSIVKFFVIGAAVYAVVKSEIFVIPTTQAMSARQILAYLGTTTMKILGVVGLLLLVASAFDYFIQWRRWRQQAMMTKQEAKQEMKEREGDPQIKARIRTVQRDMARKRMMKAVPKADVVITNPTHYAVAVVYSPEEGIAPKVVAKGADFLAQRIKEIAKENNVPLVENVPLARTLYKHVKVGQMIPRSLYQAVAEVLAYVYRIRGRKPEQTKGPDVTV